ncbi:glycosyltransferase [Lentimicrobium saccharophilum]|uniref:Glycosyltransferase n=1 Tax=Lentimicrobium saccharophilum TaxID=1678841 RepID=A0A0S7C3S4_9BACT|nr:glycosyltransferase family 2 protein [Lentimicrobium saccharophilum]GAP44468.1 glycosyltransferase [Lentimicrobium saccharophilum]
MNNPKLSIIICVYNEEPNIRPLNKWINESITGMEYEIIYVDDGSTDRTRQEIIALNDPRVVLVEFRKNFGQSAALYAGIEQARGEYLVTMDGDLQNDPSDIPMMLKLAEDEHWDLVAGVRKNRQDGMFLRKIPSKIANAIIRKSTGVYIKDYGCTLKVFKSDLAKNIGLYGELHRFIPVLASLEGATITQVDVKHHAREFGKSKYGINRTFKVVSDLMLMVFFKKYMGKPMHLFGGIGLLFLIVGSLINGWFLIEKIMGHDIWGKPMLLLGILLLIAGIQLITIGIMAELLMRTYYESQQKRPYKIRKVHTFEA